jgi:hypothetical protein
MLKMPLGQAARPDSAAEPLARAASQFGPKERQFGPKERQFGPKECQFGPKECQFCQNNYKFWQNPGPMTCMHLCQPLSACGSLWGLSHSLSIIWVVCVE